MSNVRRHSEPHCPRDSFKSLVSPFASTQMVNIPQHRADGGLNDLNSYFADVTAFFTVDGWLVEVQECLGEGASEIESLAKGALIKPQELRKLYAGIYQTIDGSFVAQASGVQVCRLTAVDSSFWEVESTPLFEGHMLAKYGRYQSDA
jgi:hypothetical protein